MGKKLFLNVLYTIGIFVCAAVAYSAYTKQAYTFVACAVFVGALLVILKIKLLKDLRNLQK